jgi:hypothetical protein
LLQATGVVAPLGRCVSIVRRAAPSQRPARSHPIGSYHRHLVLGLRQPLHFVEHIVDLVDLPGNERLRVA